MGTDFTFLSLIFWGMLLAVEYILATSNCNTVINCFFRLAGVDLRPGAELSLGIIVLAFRFVYGLSAAGVILFAISVQLIVSTKILRNMIAKNAQS